MAGLFDMSDPTQGGLMGMYANPNTAGMLGMAQGLLAASGPSRLPVTMGQALGNGMQGMEQGFGQSLGMQQNLLKMRAMQGLMGMGGSPSGQAPSQAPSYSSLYGPNSTAPATMPPMGGLGGAADGSSASGAPQASTGIYGKSPQQLFQQGMLMNMAGMQGGGDLMRIAVEHDPSLAAQMPTDITKMGTQGGMTPDQIQQANAAGVAKANYIAPVNARPGAILRNPLTMQPMAFNPNIPTGGTPVFDASGNVIAINPLQGATDITSAMAAAKTAGEGSALPFTEGKDAAGNPLPIMSRTQAATGNLPLPLRNNNPGAVSPGGSVAQYPDLQTGLKAMDDNLASYAGKSDTGTLGQVITKWVGSPPNAPAYIKDVTARLGIGANTPVDLTNPAQRQAIATAIMLHENGPSSVFRAGQGGSPAQQSGQIYAAAPMGAQKSTETAQNAVSQQMKDSYNTLSGSDATYQQSRSALTDMLALAHQFGAYENINSKLPSDYHNMSNLVTQYDKAHATFVSNQYGALGAGTDASKGTVNDMVPGSDKPMDAKIQGLTTQLNNLDLRHLKTQFMTPSFNSGDQKGFNTISAQFDNTIKPEMMPVMNTLLGIQTKPQLAAAISRLNQQYPQYKKAIDFLGSHGMFDGVGQ